MGQMTWPMVMSHANQMYKLAEEERISGTGPALVFVYDDFLRKSTATRAEWGGPVPRPHDGLRRGREAGPRSRQDQTALNRLFEAAEPAEPKRPRREQPCQGRG